MLQDETLCETGRVEAQQLGSQWTSVAGDKITLALVSPLARSIETALLVFGTPSSVKIVIEPSLADFHWNQSEKCSLDLRLEGTTLSKLKQRFPQMRFRKNRA